MNEVKMSICKKICSECPFRNHSAKGWLGPHTVEEILHAQQFETPFSCHMQRTDETELRDILNGNIDICRGFIASASKSFKMFGQDQAYGNELRRLQEEITDADKDLVLDRRDFAQYHTFKF